MSGLRIDVWSDIACPWCYVGKRRLEAALAGFEHRAAVDVVWRSFELDPRAPRTQPADGPDQAVEEPQPDRDRMSRAVGRTDPARPLEASDRGSSTPRYARRLAAKYRMTEAEAEARIDHLVRLAAADGLTLRFDRIRPGNTFDAHRVLHLARAQGRQDAVEERFMRGYFSEGAAIGEPAVVRALAVEAGLDGGQVDELLAGDGHGALVRADQAEARELGIHGVPFFVFDGRLAASGAQPADALRATLVQAWATRAAEPATADVAEGAACGPDGCA